MEPERDPEAVVAVFRRDRNVHPYGLCDLDEPYWSASTWWRRGDAVVGLLRLPGTGLPILYAVAVPSAERGTLDLLGALADRGLLPDRLVANGVLGLGRGLEPWFRAAWTSPHTKLWLADPALLPAPGSAVVLGRGDVEDLGALFSTDPDAGDFFVPQLLDTGHYLGHREDGRLVAVAGVHAVSARHGVAAIGNVATHPAHRRRGHARRLVATLCHRLRREADVIGLNVKDGNEGAARLYRSIGFHPAVRYEEALLERRRPAP
jgi:ribosomal protein S18 acetylase RimI-like enzyme